ncbi:MAG TPA: hypothetical protein VFZ98_09705 [Vicinamibacterales bacterium]
MEPSDVRRRLRGAIEQAKRRAADRRAVADEATRVWAQRLPAAVVPAFQALQNVLNGEGHRFSVATPGETARLSLERSAEECVEMALDTDRELPAVVVRATRGRGRRMISSERIVAEGPEIAELGQDAVIGVLIEEIVPFIER